MRSFFVLLKTEDYFEIWLAVFSVRCDYFPAWTNQRNSAGTAAPADGQQEGRSRRLNSRDLLSLEKSPNHQTTMPITAVNCECCKTLVDQNDAAMDDDLGGPVCPECREDLKTADTILRVQWKKEGKQGPMPPLYKGPFHGSSLG